MPTARAAAAAPPGRLRVAGTIVNRARDQQAVLAALTARAADPKDAIGRRIDAGNIAVIGYSMGGFGLLATAGAPYDKAGGAIAPLGGRLDDQTVRTPIPGLKAIVAIAPWGGQPPYRSWTPAALTGINVPSLWIAGDRDDVSNYADGVRWLYDRATARTAGCSSTARRGTTSAATRRRPRRSPAPTWPRASASRCGGRSGSTRSTSISSPPSSTASSRATPPTARISTSRRSTATRRHGPTRRAALPDAAQTTYWPGFQRRWLLGLELHHDAGQ